MTPKRHATAATSDAIAASAAPVTFQSRRRWLRFSLRTLLVVITVLSIWLGIKVDQARRQKRAVDALRALGAEIAYEHQRVKKGFDTKLELDVPRWARDLCGDDFFQTVKAVWFWGKFSPDGREVYPHKITDEDLKCLADLPRLERLHIHKALITDAGLAHLPHPKRLAQLSLYDTQVGDGFVRRLKGTKRLEVFDLDNTKVTDEGLAELHGITTLTSLSLRGTRSGDRALAAFADCERLVTLDVGTLTTDAGLRQFKSFARLDTLVADKAPITGEAFRGWKLPPADMVAVRDGMITDDNLPPLVSAVADVRVVNLKGNSISDAGLAHFKGLRKTEILLLMHNPLKGRELRHLAALPGIAWISLHGCPLDDPDLKSLEPIYTGTRLGVNLSLGKTSIRDADLAKISGFTNLTHLSLNETRIRDAGLPHLYSLKLAVLDLRGTQVTAEGIKQLKQAIRGVMIAWDEDLRPAGWPW